METTRNVVIDVLNKYGNLVPENVKQSVAQEIVEGLVAQGHIEDDEPEFVTDKFAELEDMVEVKATKKQASIDKTKAGFKVNTSKSKTRLSKSDELFMKAQSKKKSKGSGNTKTVASSTKSESTDSKWLEE